MANLAGTRDIGCVGALVIIVGLGALLHALDGGHDDAAAPTAAPTAVTITIDSKTARLWRRLVIRHGFACPRIVHVRDHGPSAFGERYEILCGPIGLSGDAYADQHYAVYPERGIVNLCARFEMFSAECV